MKYLPIAIIVITAAVVFIRCTSTRKPTGVTQTLPATDTLPPPSQNSGGGSENFFANRWVLVEVEGQPVTSPDTNREAHLLFYPGQVSRVSGSTGCNNLNGTFELSGVNKIKFSPLATTKMMCTGISGEVETKFLSALEKVNNYSFIDGYLLFNNGRILVAKLKAVDIKQQNK